MINRPRMPKKISVINGMNGMPSKEELASGSEMIDIRGGLQILVSEVIMSY